MVSGLGADKGHWVAEARDDGTTGEKEAKTGGVQ